MESVNGSSPSKQQSRELNPESNNDSETQSAKLKKIRSFSQMRTESLKKQSSNNIKEFENLEIQIPADEFGEPAKKHIRQIDVEDKQTTEAEDMEVAKPP